MNTFGAHGTLDVRQEGQLLIVEGTGPWNLESLEASGVVANPLVDKLSSEPWGVVLIIHGEPIYVPEAAEALVTIVREQRQRGRIASAVVVEDCFSPRFARNHIGEIYDRAGETYKFLPDMDQAKEYVLEQITAAMLSGLPVEGSAQNSSSSLP